MNLILWCDWLPEQASTYYISRSFPLRITRCSRNKMASFIPSSKYSINHAGYWRHLFLCVYGLWLRLGPETSKTITSTISTNLDLMHVWSITQKAYMSSKTLQWLFLELSYYLKKAELKNISRFFWLYEQNSCCSNANSSHMSWMGQSD